MGKNIASSFCLLLISLLFSGVSEHTLLERIKMTSALVASGPQPFQYSLTLSETGRYQRTERVHVAGGVSLSIQGAMHSYCSPRENLPPTSYTEMEVVIFLDDEWATLRLSAQKALGCHDDMYGGSSTTVFAYIPVGTIQALIDSIKADPSIVISLAEARRNRGLSEPVPYSRPGELPAPGTGDYIEAEFVVK